LSTVDFSGAEWRKSGRSGDGSGGNCVEVAFADWRKSSRSGDGSNGGCVEVAFAEVAVGVRDSKHSGGSHLVFGGVAWRRALRSWC
jgi:hypothetical protein